tara:strand:- start:2088 stop:3077 length:990 start_codon:yes stop_codon:yes gene_type:complete
VTSTNNKQAVQHLKVDADDEEVRLDRWLRRTIPGITYSRLVKWIRTGQIRIDGQRAKPGQKLLAGQIVRLPPIHQHYMSASRTDMDRNQDSSISKVLTEIKNNILYRDGSLIAINKPSGLAVQGGSKTKIHLDMVLNNLTFDQKTKPKLVHRLDKDTSGVLLLARTGLAARKMTQMFRNQEVNKVYWALVSGIPNKSEGVIEMPIKKFAGSGGEKVTASSGGRAAVTNYSVIENIGQKASWIKLRPLTGRTHQLRVHCKLLGTPIVGDVKYGRYQSLVDGLPRKLHLHARSVTFPHPTTGQVLELVAPLIGHCKNSWEKLGLNINQKNE